jgi:hypothetical protein
MLAPGQNQQYVEKEMVDDECGGVSRWIYVELQG